MHKFQIGRLTGFLGVFLSLLLLAAVGCTAQEKELLEGLLREVDTVNGEITIVTKDGKTIFGVLEPLAISIAVKAAAGDSVLLNSIILLKPLSDMQNSTEDSLAVNRGGI